MQKRIKIIASYVIFICITVCVLYHTSKILENKIGVEKYGPFFRSGTDFDVIFMGTSHMWNGILPQELWEEYGITSYNWGYSNCTLATDYYLLQEILKQTSPKLVVVDLYGILEYEQHGNGKYGADGLWQQRVSFDTLPLSWNKVKAVEDVLDDYDDRLDFLFNFLAYHTRWEELSKEDFRPDYTLEKGACLLAGAKSVEYARPEGFEPVEIHTVCSGYVGKIIDLCKAENVEILFVYATCPTFSDWVNCAGSLEAFMQDYDAPYVNMIYIDSVNNVTDFYSDGGHLNYSGQKKFTSYMGDYIKRTYGLADHRGEAGYDAWEKDHAEYVEFKKDTLRGQSGIHTKLMLTYGTDFRVDIQVDPESELYQDWTTQMFIWNLGDSAEVRFVDGLEADGEACQMVFTFYDAKTGEVICVDHC